MRGHGAALATIILMVGIAAAAAAMPRKAELGRMAGGGPVTISSDKSGVALLTGTGIKPGDSITGLITLSNKGDETGNLSLLISGLRDHPGLYGGHLSSVLRLRVDDLTSHGAPVETTLARTTPLGLGDLKGREARTYKVTATFPDTGLPPGPALGDNAQQGSSVEVALAWQLTEAGPAATPTATATPVAPARPAPVPPTTVTPAPAPAPAPRALLVTLRIPHQRVLKPRGITAFATCQVGCKVRFTARTDTSPLGGRARRTLQGRHVLRGERRWHALRAGAQRRVFLKLQPDARRSLKLQLHRHGRAAITITAHMRSRAGNRVARRRIVLRTFHRGERRATAPRG